MESWAAHVTSQSQQYGPNSQREQKAPPKRRYDKANLRRNLASTPVAGMFLHYCFHDDANHNRRAFHTAHYLIL
jgi:hypothetical protein